MLDTVFSTQKRSIKIVWMVAPHSSGFLTWVWWHHSSAVIVINCDKSIIFWQKWWDKKWLQWNNCIAWIGGNQLIEKRVIHSNTLGQPLLFSCIFLIVLFIQNCFKVQQKRTFLGNEPFRRSSWDHDAFLRPGLRHCHSRFPLLFAADWQTDRQAENNNKQNKQ